MNEPFKDCEQGQPWIISLRWPTTWLLLPKQETQLSADMRRWSKTWNLNWQKDWQLLNPFNTGDVANQHLNNTHSLTYHNSLTFCAINLNQLILKQMKAVLHIGFVPTCSTILNVTTRLRCFRIHWNYFNCVNSRRFALVKRMPTLNLQLWHLCRDIKKEFNTQRNEYRFFNILYHFFSCRLLAIKDDPWFKKLLCSKSSFMTIFLPSNKLHD